MRIGYAVDDAMHRALIVGLRRRWCPEAELMPGHMRGRTKLSRRREVAKICEELALKGVDAVVFLTDCDVRPWRQVQQEERQRVPPERSALTVVGVADRNGECWICMDADYVATVTGLPASDFRVNDPSGPFKAATADMGEAEIAKVIAEAPLRHWLRNDSFEDFYKQVRSLSQRLGCTVENLLDREIL